TYNIVVGAGGGPPSQPGGDSKVVDPSNTILIYAGGGGGGGSGVGTTGGIGGAAGQGDPSAGLKRSGTSGTNGGNGTYWVSYPNVWNPTDGIPGMGGTTVVGSIAAPGSRGGSGTLAPGTPGYVLIMW
nr:IPTL-CTERM sorting domain-containing protein [Acidobacteriota bacterium]